MKAVIATSNQGKLREFERLFDDIAIEIEPQSKFNVPDAVERITLQPSFIPIFAQLFL